MIISGPIVRDSNRKSLSIWFVLNNDTNDVKLFVYTDSQLANKCSSSNQIQKLAVGKNCFIYLVSASLNLPNSSSKVFYDLKIDGVSFGSNDLKALLCLNQDPLPSVFLPNKHTQLLQASCRKPHAKYQVDKEPQNNPKQPDQMSRALELVEANANSAERPSQLFLTGDQIYADDVSPIVLDYLHQLQDKLGLREEFVRIDSLRIKRPRKMFHDNRSTTAKKKFGFTSTAKHSHLLCMPEFLCMYFFAFSGTVGQLGIGFKSYDDLKPRLRKAPGSKKLPKTVRAQYRYSERDYKKEVKNIAQFDKQASSSIRKLLANVPTYMIFDDHEITDDWNLTSSNAEKLSSSRVGEHVLNSGLGAYLICQHWGNQPTQVTQLIEKMGSFFSTDQGSPGNELSWLQNLSWEYELKQNPPVVVLDTRTKRDFGPDGDGDLALMNNIEIDKLGDRLSQFSATNTLLVVSPTPMLGFNGVEFIQMAGFVSSTFADKEPWVANQGALKRLKAALKKCPGVKDIAVFSGDVHYAFARRDASEETEGVTTWQLTSSACCNVPMGGKSVLEVLDNVAGIFTREQTKYLRPDNDNQSFITSDKNIGLLELDGNARPKAFNLYSTDSNAQPYEKRFDLINFTEY